MFFQDKKLISEGRVEEGQPEPAFLPLSPSPSGPGFSASSEQHSDASKLPTETLLG